MRRALLAAACALLLVVLHASLRALGLVVHTSAIAGMPIDAWSLPIAALYVVSYLGAVVIAPVLAMAGLFESAASIMGTLRAPSRSADHRPRPRRATSRTSASPADIRPDRPTAP